MTYAALRAVGTDRLINPSAIDVPLVLVCYAQATQAAGEQIETAIRDAFPDAQQVLVAHIIDLHGVPRMFRGVAEGILRGEFDKAVESLKEGQAPYDYTIILPDWDGSAIAALGLENVDQSAGVAVFAPPGRLLGANQGNDPAAAALRLLESLD